MNSSRFFPRLGLKVGLAQNWSADYLCIDFGSETYGLIGTTNGLTSTPLGSR
jgi:hypothetical protein